MSKFMNGCELKETLEVFEKFENIPHCHTMSMRKEDFSETVLIGFELYGDDYLLEWESCDLYKIKIYRDMDNELFELGNSTLDKLLNLLKSTPYIYDILED